MRVLERIDRRWCWLGVATLGLVGCAPPRTADRDAPIESRSPPDLATAVAAIEYAGCAEVFDDGTCVLDDERALRLWLPEASWTPATDAPTVVEDEPLVDRSDAIDGGRLLWLTVPEAASRVVVRAGDATGVPVWTLAVGGASGDAGALSDAAYEGYLAMRRGQFERAAELLARARDEHAAAGRRWSELSTATNLVHCHILQGRLDRARAVVESFDVGPRAPAEAHFAASFYRGLLAEPAGDVRTGLEALTAAASRARRLGMRRELGMSIEKQVSLFRRLGRAREAAALFEHLDQEAGYALETDRARLLHNRGWSLLLAREAGETLDEAVDLLALLDEVRQRYEGAYFRIDQRFNARLNLALAHIQEGRSARAREFLDQAGELLDEPPAEYRSWWLDIEARIVLAEGHVDEALALYDRLERLADSAFDLDSRRRALVGRARVLVAAGRLGAARAALGEAERTLDEQSQWIPLDEGRESFVAGAGAATRLHLDLLLRDGLVAEAFAMARRSRSRVLRGLQVRDRLADLAPSERLAWDQAVGDYHRLRAELEERVAGDWRLSADELADARRERAQLDGEIRRALDRAFAVFGRLDTESELPPSAPGELTLLYHPLPGGWVGFAALDGAVSSRRLEWPTLDGADPVDAEDAARILVEPFASQIAAAERVRVLPLGVLRRVDFHALPLAGEPLLAGRPVVYGLDVVVPEPIQTAGESIDTTSRRALIVTDPLGDLPAAEQESERVRRSLARARPRWAVDELRGEAARAGAVLREMLAVDWLHYAGHGEFSGRAGWRSALPLAGGSRLTLGDLLALERAPARVVLSACDAARVPSIDVEGLGIAHGFLLAGARQVVAADRPVDDVAAAELIEVLYREQEKTPDLAEALRRAQLERRAAGDASWAAFRVLEP